MSSVTFSTAVGGDGSTVTDDNNATTGLREGGWKTRFVPCFTQQVAVANYIVTKAGEASTSASAASASATAAAASYDSFDDRYLGSKTSDPSVDNDGNTLLVGALYWNSTSSVMKVWSGSAWVSYNPAIGYLPLSGGTMTGDIVFKSGQTFAGTLPLAGGTMTGAITFAAGQTVANLAAGSAGTIPYQSAAGTTAMLSAGTSGQVLTSGGAGAPTWSPVAGGNLKTQEFTSSGTWTKPANVSKVFITLVGGGASGRGGTTTYGGAGGGAGAYLQANLTVTGNLTVTIGAGGTGDSTTGNSGGASSISGGASLTAGGGAKYNTTPTDGASSTGLQAATAVSIPGSYTQYGSGNAGGQGQAYSPYAQGGGGGGAGGSGGSGSTFNSSSSILLWNGHGDGGAGRNGKAGGGGAGYMTGDGAAFGSGSCGGGKGGNSTGVNGFSAEANSGSGGGGGGTATSGTTSGGDGGSGYCLIQWVE